MKKRYLFISILFFFALNSVMAQPNVFYEIVNIQVVSHPTLGSATSFDVLMYADQAGTFHSRGQLYISYNPARFGTTVDLNGTILEVEGPMLAGVVSPVPGFSVPKYATINRVDNKESEVAYTWLANFNSFLPSSSTHNEVLLTPTLLYTIFIKNQNLAAPANIALATTNMIGQQFYLTDINNDGRPDEVPYGNGFLPVELLDFQAEKLDKQRVELNWVTATELNNDHFVIEKSHEGESFFPIGKVAGAGTSDEVQSYQYLDESSMAVDNYYRLKQVDIDGTAKYSDVVKVHFDLDQIDVYPSPTQGNVFVKYTGLLTGDARVRVTDLSGKMMTQMRHNFGSNQEALRLDFSSFPEGMYMVQVTKADGSVETHRVVKLKP